MNKQTILFTCFALSLILSGCNRDNKTLCTTSECDQYLDTWKDYFLEINEMTEAYFDEHVTPTETFMRSNDNGQSFNIRYEVEIDWLTVEVRDKFQVFINPGVDKFPQLNLPKDEFLFDNSVKAILDVFAFESNVTRVASTEKLGFTSQKKALKALQDLTGENVDFRRYEYKDARLTYDPYIDDDYIDTASGERGAHPYMYGVKEVGDNDCVCGEIDLVSGKGGEYNCECEIQ